MMGRLFWKFFFFFWLAQVLTSVGVGIAIWSRHQGHPDNRPPPPRFEQRADLPPPDAPGHPPPPPHRGPPWLPPPTPLIAGSIVSLLFAALLAWYVARPIRTLRAAFEDVAAGRLDTRAGARMGSRRDELAALGSDFDRMAERLQDLVDDQRRLLHDVSHELRSPLARLQAAADLMRQQPTRADELTGRIERDVARMDHLVGELLTLARLDAGLSPVDEAVDLQELLAGIVEDAEVEAVAKGCRIVLDVADLLPVRASAELLHRAVENIVRNALRHSPAGGAVEIRAESGAMGLMIVVADRGPGVAEDELEAIFRPFRRGTQAGPAAGKADGYGLGLALARRVVEQHGGTVTAANRTGGGLEVSLRLPLSV